VGNRAQGERLARLCRDKPEALAAAVALQLLCPSIPLLFMGEEQGAETPFLYFTSFSDPEFAARVSEGRRAEFAAFLGRDGQTVPDPNSEESWLRSRLPPGEDADARRWRDRYRELLALRRRHVTPWLKGAACESVMVQGEGSLVARWVLGNGCRLTLYCNLSGDVVDLAPDLRDAGETLFYESSHGAAAALTAGTLPAHCTLASVLHAGEAAQAESP